MLKFRSPGESIQKISLPVKIIRFPTTVDIGSRYVTDTMAKVLTGSLDLLPQLPQTSLSVPERVFTLPGLKQVVAKDSL